MAKFQISEGSNWGDILVDVEVNFKIPLTNIQLREFLLFLSQQVSGSIAQRLNLGIVSLDITLEKLHILVMFNNGEVYRNDGINKPPINSEDISRVRINFVFYLFALINQYIKIDSSALPNGFEYFINLPITLNNEYGWDL